MGFYINTAPDVKLYVEDLNPSGCKTILFIHGWPADHRMFEYQFGQLPKKDCRCIGIDCRGFGKSDKPWTGYDYDTQADDIRCVIESLGLQDIVLAGHSTGGAIAIRYMARHQGFGVSKLALCAAAAPSLVQRPYFPHGLKREDVVKIIHDTQVDRPKMLEGFSEMFFFRQITKPFSDWFFQMGLAAAGWATAAVAAVWLDEEQLFSDMGMIDVPTLILHGINDRVCLFPLGEAQHQGIKNSLLIPFRYSGHGLFYDERDKFTRELVNFVDKE